MTLARRRPFAMAIAALLATLAWVANVRADDAPAAAPTQTQQQANEAEQNAADATAKLAKVVGPAKVQLKDQGTLDLPQGYGFIPQPEAGRLMHAYGTSSSDALIGLVLPEGGPGQWWSTLDFLKEGYVKDDDAKNWNADELLKNLKEGNETQNEERRKRGFPALEITGWVEPPAYDAPTHRLVWSALVRQVGKGDDTGSVNYNTYALGREGYFSLDLITSQAAIGADKSAAKTLLASIAYDKGKGYEDFNASTDHVAAYGIAALVGGIALKKLGLFALGAAFFLKFIKVIGLGLVVLVAAVRRLFVRKKPGEPR